MCLGRPSGRDDADDKSTKVGDGIGEGAAGSLRHGPEMDRDILYSGIEQRQVTVERRPGDASVLQNGLTLRPRSWCRRLEIVRSGGVSELTARGLRRRLSRSRGFLPCRVEAEGCVTSATPPCSGRAGRWPAAVLGRACRVLPLPGPVRGQPSKDGASQGSRPCEEEKVSRFCGSLFHRSCGKRRADAGQASVFVTLGQMDEKLGSLLCSLGVLPALQRSGRPCS